MFAHWQKPKQKGEHNVITEQQAIKSFEILGDYFKQEGLGDPFNYGRAKEWRMALALGHKLANKQSGADAFDKNGNPLEYKTTTGADITGTYNGVSVQDTWSEQEKYLKEKKIAKYKDHFIARTGKEGDIKEVWKVSGQKVYEILLPKFRRQWHGGRSGKKDPRLGATLTSKEIKKHGVQVL